MHAGEGAAHNIHQQLLQAHTGQQPKWSELSEIPPMIVLALGRNAVGWAKHRGVLSGPELMGRFFEDDLGLKKVIDHLGLNEDLGSIGAYGSP